MAEMWGPDGTTPGHLQADTMGHANRTLEVTRTSRMSTDRCWDGMRKWGTMPPRVILIEFSFRYFQAQSEIGERVQGWVFWTWKV